MFPSMGSPDACLKDIHDEEFGNERLEALLEQCKGPGSGLSFRARSEALTPLCSHAGGPLEE
jgi:hypothetical protein